MVWILDIRGSRHQRTSRAKDARQQCRSKRLSILCMVLAFFQATFPGFAGAKPLPLDLNLNSTQQTLSARNLHLKTPITIQTGSSALTITRESQLTPAEWLAARQLRTTKNQSLVLGELGNATGGSFFLNSRLGRWVTSLSIPDGVSGSVGRGSHKSNLSGLNLGNLNFKSDPTFATTSNIIITGNIASSKGNLVLEAGGNITATAPVTIRVASNKQGFDANFFAGINITSGASSGNISPSTAKASATTAGGPSPSGGNITLLGDLITSPDTKQNANGGNVGLFAYASSAGNNGNVDVSNCNINTSGSGTGAAGNLTVLAGGNVGATSIRLGAVNANGASGVVRIHATQPTNNVFSFNSDGTLISGALPGPGTIANGTVSVSGNIDATTSIGIHSGGSGAIANLTATPRLIAPIVELSADASSGVGSGMGSIGTSTNAIQVFKPNSIIVSAKTGGDVFLRSINSNAVTLATSFAGTGKTFSFTQATPNGALTIPAGNTVTVSGPGGTTELVGDHVFNNGTLNSASVTVKPFTANTTIGFAGGAGSLQITQTFLSHITADTVTIGDNAGNVTANSSGGTYAIPTSGPGSYNLIVKTSGSFTNLGTITLGAKNLTVLANSDITSGAISGVTASAVALNSSAGTVTVNQPINLGTAGSSSLQLSSGGSANAIALNQPVTAASMTLTANASTGAIAQVAAGVVNTNNLQVNTSSGTANLLTAQNSIGSISDTVTGAGSVQLMTTLPLVIGNVAGSLQNLTLVSAGNVSNTSPFTVNQFNATGSAPAGNSAILIKFPITASTMSLTASSGNIDQFATGVLTATDSVTLNLPTSTSTANLNTASNNVAGLSITGAAGTTVTLANGSNNIALNSFSGQNLTISSAGAITTQISNTTTSFNILTLNGLSIAFHEPITVSSATLTSTATTGTGINIDGLLTSTNTLTLQSASNDANAIIEPQAGAGSVTAQVLTITLSNGGTANLANINDIFRLNTSGFGNYVINVGSNNLQLGQIQAHSLTITGTGEEITTAGNGAFVQILDLTAGSITISQPFTAFGSSSATLTSTNTTGTGIFLVRSLDYNTVTLNSASNSSGAIIQSQFGGVQASQSFTINLTNGGTALLNGDNSVTHLNASGGNVSINCGSVELDNINVNSLTVNGFSGSIISTATSSNVQTANTLDLAGLRVTINEPFSGSGSATFTGQATNGNAINLNASLTYGSITLIANNTTDFNAITETAGTGTMATQVLTIQSAGIANLQNNINNIGRLNASATSVFLKVGSNNLLLDTINLSALIVSGTGESITTTTSNNVQTANSLTLTGGTIVFSEPFAGSGSATITSTATTGNGIDINAALTYTGNVTLSAASQDANAIIESPGGSITCATLTVNLSNHGTANLTNTNSVHTLNASMGNTVISIGASNIVLGAISVDSLTVIGMAGSISTATGNTTQTANSLNLSAGTVTLTEPFSGSGSATLSSTATTGVGIDINAALTYAGTVTLNSGSNDQNAITESTGGSLTSTALTLNLTNNGIANLTNVNNPGTINASGGINVINVGTNSVVLGQINVNSLTINGTGETITTAVGNTTQTANSLNLTGASVTINEPFTGSGSATISSTATTGNGISINAALFYPDGNVILTSASNDASAIIEPQAGAGSVTAQVLTVNLSNGGTANLANVNDISRLNTSGLTGNYLIDVGSNNLELAQIQANSLTVTGTGEAITAVGTGALVKTLNLTGGIITINEPFNVFGSGLAATITSTATTGNGIFLVRSLRYQNVTLNSASNSSIAINQAQFAGGVQASQSLTINLTNGGTATLNGDNSVPHLNASGGNVSITVGSVEIDDINVNSLTVNGLSGSIISTATSSNVQTANTLVLTGLRITINEPFSGSGSAIITGQATIGNAINLNACLTYGSIALTANNTSDFNAITETAGSGAMVTQTLTIQSGGIANLFQNINNIGHLNASAISVFLNVGSNNLVLDNISLSALIVTGTGESITTATSTSLQTANTLTLTGGTIMFSEPFAGSGSATLTSTATSGNGIDINAALTYTGNVTLTAASQDANAIIESPGGSVTGATLSVNLSNHGTANLNNTNAVQTLNASGGNTIINVGANNIVLGAISVDSLTIIGNGGDITTTTGNTTQTANSLNLTAGTVTLTEPFSGSGSATISSTATTGIGIDINAALTYAGNITLNSASNDQNAITESPGGSLTSASLTLNLTNNGTSNLANINNPGTFNASGGNLVINVGGNNIMLGQINVNTLTITGSGEAITTAVGNTIQTANSLNLTGSNVTINEPFTGTGTANITSTATTGTGIDINAAASYNIITLNSASNDANAVTESTGGTLICDTLNLNNTNNGTFNLSNINNAHVINGSGGNDIINVGGNPVTLGTFSDIDTLTVTGTAAITTFSSNIKQFVQILNLTGSSVTLREPFGFLVGNSATLTSTATSGNGITLLGPGFGFTLEYANVTLNAASSSSSAILGAGTINAAVLTINLPNGGTATLTGSTNNFNSVAHLNASGGSVSIESSTIELDNINLSGSLTVTTAPLSQYSIITATSTNVQTANTLTLSAYKIALDEPFTGSNAATITGNAAFGAIKINAPLIYQTGTITLNAQSADTTDVFAITEPLNGPGSITAQVLTINTGAIAGLNNVNNVGHLNGTLANTFVGGSVFLNVGTNNLVLDSILLNALVVTGTGQAVTTATSNNVQTANTLTLTGSTIAFNEPFTGSGSATMTSTASTGNGIEFNASMTYTGSMTVSSVANVVEASNVVVKASSVNFSTQAGSVQGFNSSPFVVEANTLSANVLSGDVFLADQNANQTTLDNSSASGTFSFSANGSLIVKNVSAQFIDIRNVTGAYTVSSGAQIKAGNNNTTPATIVLNAGNGPIVLLSNATITTSATTGSGTITIAVGNLPQSPTNTGQAFFPSSIVISQQGTGLVGAGPTPAAIVGPSSGTATVTAKNANVMFSSPNQNLNITLSAGVTILADPPIGLPYVSRSNTRMLQAVMQATALSGGVQTPVGISAITAKPLVATHASASSSLGNAPFDEPTSPGVHAVPQWSAPAGAPINCDFLLLNPPKQVTLPTTCCSNIDFDASPDVTATDSGMSEDSLVPISFVTPVNPVGIFTYHTGQGRTLIKHSGTARISERQPGVLWLDSGEILIATREPVQVNVQGHRIEVLPGAIALVKREHEITTLTCLFGDNTYPAHIVVDGHPIRITPGQEILIAPDHDAATAVCKGDQIGRRCLVRFKLNNGISVQRSEVSIVSLFQSSELLRNIRHSDRDTDRVITTKLCRMAACLTMVTAGHGAYRQSSR